MKDYYKGFYKPTIEKVEEAWSSDETLFVFDTNVFLNLYGYAEQTRRDFFDLLKFLGNKIWIPYHVGLEYQRRRLEVIRDEKAIFNKINTYLEKIENIFKDDFEQLALKRRFPKLYENTEKLNKEIIRSISAYKKSVSYWDEKQPCVRSHDSIRETLNNLLQDKVGNPPENQDWLNTIYKEGEVRYENKIPPGYKDINKSKSEQNTFSYDGLKYDRQYGDLILWKQIIIKSKQENIKNIIFITDDSKEDWWYILDSRGKKQIGPHANLQGEIYREANIDVFHMYNTSSFLESGKKILKLGVHDSSIQDANTIFIQSINYAARSLESNLEQKETMDKIIKRMAGSLNENDRYNLLIKKYEFDRLTKEEIEKLKNRMLEKIRFKNYMDYLRDANSDEDNEDDQNE